MQKSLKISKSFFETQVLSIFSKISVVRTLFSLVNFRRLNHNYLVSSFANHIINYPTPISLTYAWSFGSLAGVCLVIQIVSGLLLSIYYTPNINLAFTSVEFIMRDVSNGWLVRYIHANGASMFFIVMYCHIGRGLYYGSYMYPREWIWVSGVVLFFLVMATAFTGYVLPWGQMSFWGITVVTNMITILPYGKKMLEVIWGGYVIKNPTLQRVYTFHFLLPFIIAAITLIHLALLHKVGSSDPIGSDTGVDMLPFYPYFVVKDIHAFSWFLFVFAFFVFYYPNVLNHADNYIPANPFETPAHVQPEWYLLPYFSMLRGIPHKTGGILVMFGSIMVLFIIPFINTSYIRNTTFRPIFKPFFWLFVGNFVLLIWSGTCPVKYPEFHWPYVNLIRYTTIYYFVFFLFIIPFSGKLERFLLFYNLSENSQLNKHS